MPKRDGLIGATLTRVGVVAHKIFAAFRERQIKLAAQGQGEVYARVWCDLSTNNLKHSSCVIKLHCTVFLNAEHTGAARTIIGPPVTNQPGVHLLLCTRTPHQAYE
jgi:acetyltransferase-like isoleucine patch superfamily enzyme